MKWRESQVFGKRMKKRDKDMKDFHE